jgi:5-methylthioribose kinase
MTPWLLDPDNSTEIARYLTAQRLVQDAALPLTVARAGAGNMNLTLRVTTADGHSVILKQGRPWVEKYPHIPAPFERTIVEAAFYRAVRDDVPVASRMPALLHVDEPNHVIALEDIGAGGDCTPIYAGDSLPTSTLSGLLDWLAGLAAVPISSDGRAAFHNRAMRALNHEHIFELPLRPANGLDLDAITPGLGVAAQDLTADAPYRETVAAIGRRYLQDGLSLVHGDFFPGSWLRRNSVAFVIDPEFCFMGDAEFDYGVLTAHLILADAPASQLGAVAAAVAARRLDAAVVAGYAGVEIMRRLIGVAQLPLTADLPRKRAWLTRSRRLVVEPNRGLA